MKRFMLMVSLLLTALSGFSQTQLPSSYAVSLATIAPHRPNMERNVTGVGYDIFHGGLLEYKHHENHDALDEWIDDYPAEAAAYAISIKNYINTYSETLFTGTEYDLYIDLKTQWVMVCHILDEEVYPQQ